MKPDRIPPAPPPDEGGRPRLRIVPSSPPAALAVATARPAPSQCPSLNPALSLAARLQLRAASLQAQALLIADGHVSSGLDEILASTAALLRESARVLGSQQEA